VQSVYLLNEREQDNGQTILLSAAPLSVYAVTHKRWFVAKHCRHSKDLGVLHGVERKFHVYCRIYILKSISLTSKKNEASQRLG